jgi:putative NADH-flavin reductase
MKLAILGASGATGRLLVQKALDAGHTVRALVRDPKKLAAGHPALELVVGDATRGDDVARLVAGCDVTISALGPTPEQVDVASRAAEHVIAAGVRRYVVISGAGLDVPGDHKDVTGKIVSFFVRTLSPAIFRDKVREHALLAASDVGWTLVRPPRLTNDPATGAFKTDLTNCPGNSVSRADLAAFLLQVAGDDGLIGKAPFISG